MPANRDDLFALVRSAALATFGPRLVSLAVFGSYGRGTARPGSDLDLLVVVRDLPPGRLARWEEWAPVEARVAEGLRGRPPVPLSPVLKTPAEVEAGSPLLLDMTQDAVILYDAGGFLAGRLDRLRQRLQELGAQRVWLDGDRWYWDLKPDYKPGEVFDL